MRDHKLRQILIGAGVTGVAALAVVLGVKRTGVFSKLKKAPKETAEKLQLMETGADNAEIFIDNSNLLVPSHFKVFFPKKAGWEDKFSLPYDDSGRVEKAIVDYLTVKKPEALKEIKSGVWLNVVLSDDSFRVINQDDLLKILKEVYPDDIAIKNAPHVPGGTIDYRQHLITEVWYSKLNPRKVWHSLERLKYRDELDDAMQ